MAGFKGATVCDGVLDSLLGSGSPATLYVRAFTVAPTKSGGGTEWSFVGYTAITVTNNSTNFPASSGQQKTNGMDYDFGTTPGGTTTQIIVGIATCKTPTGALGAGDIVYYEELDVPKSIGAGDGFKVPIGNATYAES